MSKVAVVALATAALLLAAPAADAGNGKVDLKAAGFACQHGGKSWRCWGFIKAKGPYNGNAVKFRYGKRKWRTTSPYGRGYYSFADIFRNPTRGGRCLTVYAEIHNKTDRDKGRSRICGVGNANGTDPDAAPSYAKYYPFK